MNASSNSPSVNHQSKELPDGQEELKRTQKTIEGRRGMTRRGFLGTLGAAAAGLGIVSYGIKKKMEREFEEDEAIIQEVLDHLNRSKIDPIAAGEAIKEPQFCIDGRNCTCGSCTPGGDVGNIAEDVGTHEQLAGQITTKTPGEIFDILLASGKKAIYMHTDHHAIEAIAQEFNITTDHAEHLVLHPPSKIKEQLLELVLKHVGCGHLNLILNQEKKFAEEKKKGKEPYPGIRPEFVRELMKEVYRRAWSGDKRFVIDPLKEDPDHREVALARVVSNGPMTKDTTIPRVQPNVDGHQVFVVHEGLEDVLDDDFIGNAQKITGLPPVDPAKLKEQLAKNRKQYLASSADKLAPGKKAVRVTYDEQAKRFERAV